MLRFLDCRKGFVLQICISLLLVGKGLAILSGENRYHLISNYPFLWEIITGIFLVFLGGVSLLPRRIEYQSKLYFLFPLASGSLFLHSYLKFIEVGHLPEQLIEHSLQFFLPIFWFFTVRNSETVNNDKWIFSLKIALALTFVGHGIFAVGWNGVPSHFVAMTTQILPMDVASAKLFLFFIGVFDFLAAIALFVPSKLARKTAVFYLITWGIITSLARVFSAYGNVPSEVLIWNSLPNTLYRLPHGLIVLMLIFAQDRNKS